MAEKVDSQVQSKNQKNPHKNRKSPEFQPQNTAAITRERSFVRTSNQQNVNKRRSFGFNMQSNGGNQGQMRGKPTMDIYRPPNVRSDGSNSVNKLNVHAQEFTMTSTPLGDAYNPRSSVVFPITSPSGQLPSLANSINPHQQLQYVAAANSIANRRQAGLSMGSVPHNSLNGKGGHRPILLTHSHPMAHAHQVSQQVPLITSPSSGNILHQATHVNRVKFAAEPQKLYHKPQQGHLVQVNNTYNNQQQQYQQQNKYGTVGDPYNPYANALQRSKSLSSADALTRGFAGLGLALGNEVTDIGQFSPDIQALVDTALDDPNKLNSRCLMELTSHFIKRAVEGRRYALPIARLCLNIIAREQNETFLEALLNTCRQWYQEREKLLFTLQGLKSPSRLRFTAFMAFLTEMFCQLKRRQLQLRTNCDGAPPPLVLLTLLSKCCEDCVRPPIRSLSEIECLFYVLTCIGQDMETQLPHQLEVILSMVRDAFLNASDAPPAIRRTLLQLIELQASHWQLPGNTVLYYYPSAK